MNWSLLFRSLISSVKTLCAYFIIHLITRSIILYIHKWKDPVCILELDINYYVPVSIIWIIVITMIVYKKDGHNPFGFMTTEDERKFNPPLTPQEIKELDEYIKKPDDD